MGCINLNGRKTFKERLNSTLDVLKEKFENSKLAKYKKDKLVVLSIMIDPVIKVVFDHFTRLSYLASAVLNRDVFIDGYINNEVQGLIDGSKKVIFDFSVKEKSGKYLNIEIQTTITNYIFKRIQMYSAALLRKQIYDTLGKKIDGVINIVFCKESPNYLKNSTKAIHKFNMTNNEVDDFVQFILDNLSDEKYNIDESKMKSIIKKYFVVMPEILQEITFVLLDKVDVDTNLTSSQKELFKYLNSNGTNERVENSKGNEILEEITIVCEAYVGGRQLWNKTHNLWN